MSMIVGFTGSRVKPSAEVCAAITKTLEDALLNGVLKDMYEAHHGDATGMDELVHNTIRRVRPDVRIVKHPPLYDKWQAKCDADHTEPNADYLVRNKHIVQRSDLVCAFPSEDMSKPLPVKPLRQPRSGTWHTIGVARRSLVPVYFFRYDGSLLKD